MGRGEMRGRGDSGADQAQLAGCCGLPAERGTRTGDICRECLRPQGLAA